MDRSHHHSKPYDRSSRDDGATPSARMRAQLLASVYAILGQRQSPPSASLLFWPDGKTERALEANPFLLPVHPDPDACVHQAAHVADVFRGISLSPLVPYRYRHNMLAATVCMSVSGDVTILFEKETQTVVVVETRELCDQTPRRVSFRVRVSDTSLDLDPANTLFECPADVWASLFEGTSIAPTRCVAAVSVNGRYLEWAHHFFPLKQEYSATGGAAAVLQWTEAGWRYGSQAQLAEFLLHSRCCQTKMTDDLSTRPRELDVPCGYAVVCEPGSKHVLDDKAAVNVFGERAHREAQHSGAPASSNAVVQYLHAVCGTMLVPILQMLHGMMHQQFPPAVVLTKTSDVQLALRSVIEAVFGADRAVGAINSATSDCIYADSVAAFPSVPQLGAFIDYLLPKDGAPWRPVRGLPGLRCRASVNLVVHASAGKVPVVSPKRAHLITVDAPAASPLALPVLTDAALSDFVYIVMSLPVFVDQIALSPRGVPPSVTIAARLSVELFASDFYPWLVAQKRALTSAHTITKTALEQLLTAWCVDRRLWPLDLDEYARGVSASPCRLSVGGGREPAYDFSGLHWLHTHAPVQQADSS